MRWRKAEVKEAVARIAPTREPSVCLSLSKSFRELDSGSAVGCTVEISLMARAVMAFFSARETNFFNSLWTLGTLRTKPPLDIAPECVRGCPKLVWGFQRRYAIYYPSKYESVPRVHVFKCV